MRYSHELPPSDQLLALYTDAGRISCDDDAIRLLQAVDRSLCVATAWEGDSLVGLARGVGDGVTILYIQDVIVHSGFHHGGVAAQLMGMLLTACPDAAQVVLLTEDSPASAELCATIGLCRAETRGCAAYVQFR